MSLGSCKGESIEVGCPVEDRKTDELGDARLSLDARDIHVLEQVHAEIQKEIGCLIDLPKGDSSKGHGAKVVVLRGNPEQLQRARDAVDGALCGEAIRDVLARQKGAQVVKNLESDAVAYINEHREALQAEHGMTLDIGERTVHVYSNTGVGAAVAAREALEEAIAHFTEVVTDSVTLPKRFTQAMVRQLREDLTLRQLLDKRPKVEDSVGKTDEGTSIRLRGLRRRVAEARALLEKLCEGPGGEFVALCPGLLARQDEATAASLRRDLGCLQEESGARVDLQWDCNRVALGGDAPAVSFARSRLMDILAFYFPQEFASVWVPPEFDRLAKELGRLYQSRAGPLALQPDDSAGVVWISGEAAAVQQARQQLMKVLQKSGLHEELTNLKEEQLRGEAGQRLRELQACAVVSWPHALADIVEDGLNYLGNSVAGLLAATLDRDAGAAWLCGGAQAVERARQELLDSLWAAAAEGELQEPISTSIAWLSLDEATRALAITGSKETVARAKREATAALSSGGAGSEQDP